MAILSPFKLLSKKNRFTPVFLLLAIVVSISFLTRLALLIKTGSGFEFSISNLLGVFFIGLGYDLAVASYIIIPMVLYLWFMDDKAYTNPRYTIIASTLTAFVLVLLFSDLIPKDYNADLRKGAIGYVVFRLLVFVWMKFKSPEFRVKWRLGVLTFDFIFLSFLLIFNAISEWFFWDEFSNRYNFIAVDYLVYTNEVLGNIKESYPVEWIIAAVLLIAVGLTIWIRPQLRAALQAETPSFIKRTSYALAFLIVPAIVYFSLDNHWRKFSKNEYANELAGNGMFEFGTAFWNNELDFFKFYKALPDKEAFEIIRQQLALPNAKFVSNDPFNLERDITYSEPEQKMNVVLISVESLSADFMEAFGSTKNITPFLDSLSKESLFFTNLYASGTRTVRGLEALSLAIPPTPGQSIVKRPDNGNLFTIGSVLASKGYITQYMYGGYSYFDNMGTFFGGNGYQVIDRTAIDPAKIHFANIWGVADEDMFDKAIEQLDQNHQSGKPFFTHIMTVSNHRPFTYPADRIDIAPEKQMREGAVKYTDYSIGKFIRDAKQKPWFNNTLFVIVSDHCAGSAGSVALPVTGYHIPLIFYCPSKLKPAKFERLTAQIDIAPSILGFMKMSYRSKFLGRDQFSAPEGAERAFISTYQGLGYLRDGKLVIQSPVKNIKEFKPDFTTGKAEQSPLTDSLVKQAVAYYQVASWLLKNKRYGSK